MDSLWTHYGLTMDSPAIKSKQKYYHDQRLYSAKL